MLGRFLTAAYSRKSALFFCGFYDAFALLVNAYDTTLTLDTRTPDCSSIPCIVALARSASWRATKAVLFVACAIISCNDSQREHAWLRRSHCKMMKKTESECGSLFMHMLVLRR